MAPESSPPPSLPPETELIARSVRDFVLPVIPRGSIDAGSARLAEDDAAAQGQRLHAQVQRRLEREHPGTCSEVHLECLLTAPTLEVRVRGRLDVLLPGEPGVLEEIKCTYSPAALLEALKEDAEHPFLLQLRLYAWMLSREEGRHPPACRLRVVSLLDGAEELVAVPYDPDAFDGWVQRQLAEHEAARIRARERAAERRELAARMRFPFPEPRPGQTHLMDLARQALEAGRPLMLQAPTGLGKTAALLHPALERALECDLRVFHLTPRNSQHGVAEAYVRRLREAGLPLRSVTLRAKERVCPQEEIQCTPEACPRARDYYDRLTSTGVLGELAEAGCADPATLREAADRHQLCPFELGLDAALGADLIIGDYNYALSPNATLQRFFGRPEQEARNLLLVDEAHNLPERAADWFSPVLELRRLRELRRARGAGSAKGGGRGGRARFLRQLGRCQKLVEALDGPARQLDPDPAPFLGEEQRIRKLVAQLAAEGEILSPSHPLVQLQRMWNDFCAVLREPMPSLRCTWSLPDRLRMTCLDASAHLAERFRAVAGLILFSGTLKPFDHYERLCGLQDRDALRGEVPSPFPPENRKVLIVPQVSTLYRHRAVQAPRVAELVNRVLPLRVGNYLVFFPSFDFMEMTLPLLDLPGFQVKVQPRRAGGEAIAELLRGLQEERGQVVLAVMGGSLSEGVDLPGEALIGCIVVGPPIPTFDLERRLAQAYFQERYGEGEHHASTWPAMAKAVQAAGRVIRGPHDRGLIMLLDGRFLQDAFARCLPSDWFGGSPREAVSGSLLADIRAFWEGGGA